MSWRLNNTFFPILSAGYQEMVLEKNAGSKWGWVSEKWRQEWEGTQGALLPVLLVSMPWVREQWKRKANLQLFTLHPYQLLQTHQGRKTREKGEQLLSAVGLSQAHPSVQLQLATPVTHNLGELPQDCNVRDTEPSGAGSAHTQGLLAQQQHSMGRKRGTTEICRPTAHSAALCIADRW